MSRRLTLRGVAAAVVGLACASSMTLGAHADSMSVYDEESYISELATYYEDASYIDTYDNRIESIKNDFSVDYSARNICGPAGWSCQVTLVSSGEHIWSLGADNNTIDHFDRA